MHRASCWCRIILSQYKWKPGAQEVWSLLPKFILRTRTQLLPWASMPLGFCHPWGCSVESTQTCHEMTQTWLTKVWLVTSWHTHSLTAPGPHFLLSHCPAKMVSYPSWCALIDVCYGCDILTVLQTFCVHPRGYFEKEKIHSSQVAYTFWLIPSLSDMCLAMPACSLTALPCVHIPHKGLCFCFVEQHRKPHKGKKRDSLWKSLTKFYKRLNYWVQLTQVTNSTANIPFIKQYLQIVSSIYSWYLLYKVTFDLFAVYNKR